MATALIFAGGVGQRMNSRSKPKQFLELHGKPIIIYTLEQFEYHPQVDKIMVVCLEDWIDELNGMIARFGISKVIKIVPGGATGHDSIYNGLAALEGLVDDNEIILIHDGVRPLINRELITENIKAVEEYGTAITSEPEKESVVQSIDGKSINDVPPRRTMYVAKAPQSFRYKEIYELYKRGQADGFKSIDSSHLCHEYGVPLHLVKSTPRNIKITEPADYYVFRALYEALENQQIYGI